eukprot:4197774-Pyramimonas_sp.AAC.1
MLGGMVSLATCERISRISCSARRAFPSPPGGGVRCRALPWHVRCTCFVLLTYRAPLFVPSGYRSPPSSRPRP